MSTDWLGIDRATLDDEERTLNARLTSGDLCRQPVDDIPGACVRPRAHDGRCYRLALGSEL